MVHLPKAWTVPSGLSEQVKSQGPKTCPRVLLSIAQDWVMSDGLDQQLKIPSYMIQSSLRLDIILVSRSTRKLILLELTVAWEDKMEDAQERERA